MRGATAGVAALALVLGGCSALGVGGDDAAGEPTVLVMDASASMFTDDAPGPRIEAAKAAANGLIEGLPDEAVLGLVTYGTSTDDAPESQAAGCQDVTTLAEPVELGSDGHRAALLAEVGGLEPRGYTPIAESLRQAAGLLPEGDAAIIVVSDGEDACGDPPCEAAAELKEQKPGLRISTVGFKTATPELACIARTTGGLFVTADDADQLASRVQAARDADQNAAALTPTGLGGIDVGAHYNDISAAHKDFPGQGEGVTEGDYTVITYVDCDYVFNGDGVVVEVRPHGGRTVDGLAVGDSIDRATELYGDEVDPSSVTDTSNAASGTQDSDIRYFAASREAGTAWKVIADDDRITTIVLCQCLPGTGSGSGRTSGGSDQPRDDGPWTMTEMIGQTEVTTLRPYLSDGSLRPEADVIASSGGGAVSCRPWHDRYYSCGALGSEVSTAYFCAVTEVSAWCPVIAYGELSFTRMTNVTVLDEKDESMPIVEPAPYMLVLPDMPYYYFVPDPDLERPDATALYKTQDIVPLWAPKGRSAIKTNGGTWSAYRGSADSTAPLDEVPVVEAVVIEW